MATEISGTDGTLLEVRIPTYEELLNGPRPPRLSADCKRLLWHLNGPLKTSIWVMESARPHPDSVRKAYFQQASDSETSWHPISQSSLTEPKVSSITVHVNTLDDWEWNWLETHRDRPYEEDGEGECELSDDYLFCCGEVRPADEAVRLVVHGSNGFVTVHDYVTTVHPWLMGLRDDILGALSVQHDPILPAETKLRVDFSLPEALDILEEKDWPSLKDKRPSA